MLNEQFDKIYCINLPNRQDRRHECDVEFRKLGIDVEYFPAIDGRTLTRIPKLRPGELGAANSHINVVSKAKEQKLDKVLVLEDDVEFGHNFAEVWDLFMRSVPDDWDMVYGGVNHEMPPTYLSANVARCNYAFTLHFIGIKHTVYDAILKYKFDCPIDVHYAKLHSLHNAYVCMPHVVFQRRSYSDIQQRVVDYDIIKRY